MQNLLCVSLALRATTHSSQRAFYLIHRSICQSLHNLVEVQLCKLHQFISQIYLLCRHDLHLVLQVLSLLSSSLLLLKQRWRILLLFVSKGEKVACNAVQEVLSIYLCPV